MADLDEHANTDADDAIRVGTRTRSLEGRHSHEGDMRRMHSHEEDMRT
jgi:hypothetical protein